MTIKNTQPFKGTPVGISAENFRLNVRRTDEGVRQYMIEKSWLYDIDGGIVEIAKSDWAEAPNGGIFLNLTVTEGDIDLEYAEQEGTLDRTGSPGKLSYKIGTIDEFGAVNQIQRGPIDLTGDNIPAWYANYDKGKKMVLVFENGIGTWVEVAICATQGGA